MGVNSIQIPGNFSQGPFFRVVTVSSQTRLNIYQMSKNQFSALSPVGQKEKQGKGAKMSPQHVDCSATIPQFNVLHLTALRC